MSEAYVTTDQLNSFGNDLIEKLAATLNDKSLAEDKKKSELTKLKEAKADDLKIFYDRVAKEEEEIMKKHDTLIKTIEGENAEKFYSKIESGGKTVGSILGKITKPIRRGIGGATSQL